MAETLKIARKGTGISLVLIHGWGLNSAVWQPCVEVLSKTFEVITVDLPGFATNSTVVPSPYTLEKVADLVQQSLEKSAVFLGWSLGGLIATKIALTYPEKVLGLITVASSPKFVESEALPGIKPNVLAMFHQQLARDTKETINDFLKIQAMGSPHIRQDIKRIRELVMQYDMPTSLVLDDSLTLLDTSDLSNELCEITQPFLRVYGKLDGLVPKSAIPIINNLAPKSEQYVLEQASHAPFISHQEEFLVFINNWLVNKFHI